MVNCYCLLLVLPDHGSPHLDGVGAEGITTKEGVSESCILDGILHDCMLITHGRVGNKNSRRREEDNVMNSCFFGSCEKGLQGVISSLDVEEDFSNILKEGWIS